MNSVQNPTHTHSRQQDLWLLVIFALVVFSTLLLSYFDPDGYVQRDGSNYLRLAQNLLDGNGYFGPVYDATGQAGSGDVLFAIWPVGYPTLVYLAAAGTGLSVFWASKVVNLFAVGVILFVFRKRLTKAHHFALILLFAEFLDLTASTGGEMLFTAALLVLAFSVADIIRPNTSRSAYVVMGLSAVSLFLIRYIGAFSLAIIGFTFLYIAIRASDYRKLAWLAVTGTFCTLFMSTYLYMNVLYSGHITGIERIAAPETASELMRMYASALLVETVPLFLYVSNKTLFIAMVQIAFAIAAFALFRRQLTPDQSRNNASPHTAVFVGCAALYVASLFFLRSVSHFDDIEYRFLAPATLLVAMIGVGSYNALKPTPARTAIGLAFVALCGLSFVYNSVFYTWRTTGFTQSYNSTVQLITERYSNVAPGSTVVFGSIHANYLFPEIENRRPLRRPYSDTRETWDAFLRRLETGCDSDLYIARPRYELNPAHTTDSVLAALSLAKADSITRYTQHQSDCG